MPMTPDEFAKVVKDLAESYQIGLVRMEFKTFTHGAVGTHSYESVGAGSLAQPWVRAFVGGS
jgi:hypothetical protein